MAMKERVINLLLEGLTDSLQGYVGERTGHDQPGDVCDGREGHQRRENRGYTVHPNRELRSRVPSAANPGDPPSGQLFIPPILGREQESSVMHESTHAFFDLTKSSIGATEEEAVCYIVDTLYNRMTGLTPAR